MKHANYRLDYVWEWKKNILYEINEVIIVYLNSSYWCYYTFFFFYLAVNYEQNYKSVYCYTI